MTENPIVLPIEARSRLLSAGEQRNGPAVYWMSRDQRTRDNAALLFAQRLALARREPLLVCGLNHPSEARVSLMDGGAVVIRSAG